MNSAQNQTKPQAEFEAWDRGLSRDGNLLVVDLRCYRFPDRCVKTNRPVGSHHKLLTLVIKNPPALEVERLKTDRRLADSDRIRITETSRSGVWVSVQLPLPLSPAWRWFCVPWGTWLIFAGIGSFALYCICLLLLRGFAQTNDLGFGSALFPLSMAGFLLGLLVNIVISWFLGIRRLEECKIWIRGVHRDWLHNLPEFIPSCGMLVREIEVETWRFWSAYAAGSGLVGLACWGLWDGVGRDLFVRWVAMAFLAGVAIAILIADSARRCIHRRRVQLKTLYTNHEPTSPWWRRRKQSRRS